MNLDELRMCLGTDGGRSASAEPVSGEARPPVPRIRARGGQAAPIAQEPLRDRLAEVEMAARLGYLLCQCTWPPQIMVLGDDGQLFRCPRCKRRRDF